MKYLIPYKTKIKNPRADSKKYECPGRIETYFYTKICETHLSEKYPSLRLVAINSLEGLHKYIYCGKQEDLPQLVEDLKSLGSTLKIEQNYNIQTFYSLEPEPEFLYEYHDVLVTCSSCHKRFDYQALQYAQGEFKACPCCGEWDCCELEYQK